MNFTKPINFNHIFIIDLLNDEELQTARKLDDDLSIYINIKSRAHIKVASKKDLVELLEAIKLFYIPQGIKPIIHIEGHGSEQSLHLPDKSYINWNELYEIISGVNFLLSNQLILFVASCYGFNYITTLNIRRYTPTFCLVSPSKNMNSGTIQYGTSIFYRTLFETKDLDKSIKKLTDYDSSFSFYNSDQFFTETMINYFKSGHYGKSSNDRIERLVSEKITEERTNGALFNRSNKRIILSQTRKAAKKFVKSRESKFDIYKRNSLKFLGSYKSEIFHEIIRLVESEFDISNKG